jgi:murein DD-endopeptidase MepM/ murein hydrolase activator NlpD
MRKLILLVILTFVSPVLFAQDMKSVCIQINELSNQVRDNRITKIKARDEFKSLMSALNRVIIKKNTTDYTWVFPLEGYKSSAIGGIRGNGYSDKGYNYFDGNKHAAHPAHDIFINDRNQDAVDDRTHQLVSVLSIADGVVLACTNEWDGQSSLRGGRYIWIYHPQLNIISYYAHNREIFVAPGDEVRQGQKIAEVGRTGFNAFKKRSPTHLHFGTYKFQSGLPVPFNCYPELLKAKNQ